MFALLNPFLKYIAGGLGFACLLLGLALHFERVHSHKLEAQLVKANETIQRITSARDEQRKTSERTVREVVEGQEKVRTVVKTIHDAPNPEGCRTPGLEMLRNVL